MEKDEFDNKGISNVLNVGHTIAHVIEKLSEYHISHGQAFWTGLVVEAEIVYKRGFCDKNTVVKIQRDVEKYGLKMDIPWHVTELVDAMLSDKKNRDSNIVFALSSKLGDCVEVKLTPSECSRFY